MPIMLCWVTCLSRGINKLKPDNSRIVIEQFASESLKGNPLKDPTTRRVPVYLPPGYQKSGQRYPTVYMLASFAERGLKLLNDSLWKENIQERMDRLVVEKKVQPMILVLPDASTKYGGSQYLNSSATGQYENHILELVKYIDGKYRSKPEREWRAVVGHSSGGYGALMFGMKYADVFGLVADHSGDKSFELVFKPEFGVFLQYYELAGGEGLKQLLDDPGGSLSRGVPFRALNVAAMAACFSPNPQAEIGFDFPFDLRTGELLQDVWERWEARDPVYMVDEYAENLRSLKLLFFDCGTRDEYNLLFGARQFAARLDEHEIQYRFEEFDGGHRNVSYRFNVSLAAISEAVP